MAKLRENKALTAAAVIAILLITIAAGYGFLRSPQFSNYLKMMFLSKISSVLGKQVIAQKIYINAYPLYIEAKDVKAYEEDGTRVFNADRVKAYISIRNILNRKVDIQRIVAVRPKLWTSTSRYQELVSALSEGKGKRRPLIKFNIHSVIIREGEAYFYDEEKGKVFSAIGADADILLRDVPEIIFKVDDAYADIKGWPSIKGGATGTAYIRDGGIEFKKLSIDSHGSIAVADASISKSRHGKIALNLDLLVESIKELFGLSSPGTGSIKAEGTIELAPDIMETSFNISLRGGFYLETLMELIMKRPWAEINGIVNFDGVVEGTLSSPNAVGRAWMDEGAGFFGVKVNRLKCNVNYSQGLLKFANGDARLYGGSGKVDVELSMPGAKPYTVDVRVKDIESQPALNLIGLDTLHLSKGRLSGRIYSSGDTFNPEGWIEYASSIHSGDIIGRLNYIRGNFRQTSDGTMTLTGFKAKTNDSTFHFAGAVNKTTRSIGFQTIGRTENIKDISAPYFNKATGSADFHLSVEGTIDDPNIYGDFASPSININGYPAGGIIGRFTYSKNLLEIRQLNSYDSLSSISIAGDVMFPDAKKIFDTSHPVYSLQFDVINADIKGILNSYGLDKPVKGAIDAKFSLKGFGNSPVIEGMAAINGAEAYGFAIDKAVFVFSYEAGVGLEIKDAKIYALNSEITGDLKIGNDGSLKLKANSDGLMLNDLFKSPLPVNFKIKLDAVGSGSTDKPEIDINALLLDGTLKESPIGDGSMKIKIIGSEAFIYASLNNDLIGISGKASLAGQMPWSAGIELKDGRYESLIGPLLKSRPDDLLVGLNGKAGFEGDSQSIKGRLKLNKLNLYMFGQSFTNTSVVSIGLDEKKITIDNFEIFSPDTSLEFSGELLPGTSYDITAYGRTSLTPLSLVSENIDFVKGTADFVLAAKGPWQKPSFYGGITFLNSAIAFKDRPQRWSSIDGYIFIDGKTAVIQSIKARVGGGDVQLKGMATLDGLIPEKVYADAVFDGVSIAVERGFYLNLNGNIVYRKSLDSNEISGDINISNARYNKRLEWKTWLLQAKDKKVSKAEVSWANKLNLNVRLTGDKAVLIDNNIARAPINIDLIIKGTLASPRLYGRAESTGGKVYFRKNEFNIVRATADYADAKPGNPVFDITASTYVKGYQIWLNLEGRPEMFELALTSDPPLDEVEILGLLTLGEYGKDIQGLESGIGAAEATAFLTGKFQDVLEQRVTEITGLDRFQIDPYVSKYTGSVTPRVTVSKRLAGDKLYVTYSAASEGQELKMEYILTNNISLLAGQEETGSVGGDFKIRFQFE